MASDLQTQPANQRDKGTCGIAWVDTPFLVDPAHVFKSPEGMLCQGTTQRKTAVMRKNLEKVVKKQKKLAAEHVLVHLTVKTIADVDEAIVFLLSDFPDIDLGDTSPSQEHRAWLNSLAETFAAPDIQDEDELYQATAQDRTIDDHQEEGNILAEGTESDGNDLKDADFVNSRIETSETGIKEVEFNSPEHLALPSPTLRGLPSQSSAHQGEANSEVLDSTLTRRLADRDDVSEEKEEGEIDEDFAGTSLTARLPETGSSTARALKALPALRVDPLADASKSSILALSKLKMWPRIGMSLTLWTESNRTRKMGEPLFLHLSSVSKAVSIDLRSCEESAHRGGRSFEETLLARLLLCPGCTLHAHRATPLVCRFKLCLGLDVVAYDMSASLGDEDKRDISHLASLMLQHHPLGARLDPEFMAKDENSHPPGQHVKSLRDAYHSAALAQLGLHQPIVSTHGHTRDYLRAIEQMARAFEISHYDKATKETALEFEEGALLPCPSRDKSKDEVVYPHLRVTCGRIQSLPMPSRDQIVKVARSYSYYDQQDEIVVDETGKSQAIRRGAKREGIYSDMLGQVFRIENRCAYIYFPRGLRLEKGYGVVPPYLLRASFVNDMPPPGLPVDDPPDLRGNDRLKIIAITLHDAAEPTPDHLKMLSFCRRLLSLSKSDACLDASNLAGFLMQPLGGDVDGFERRRREHRDLSLFELAASPEVSDQDETFLEGLYDAQRECVVAFFSKEASIVVVTGMGGTGKSHVIVKICEKWTHLFLEVKQRDPEALVRLYRARLAMFPSRATDKEQTYSDVRPHKQARLDGERHNANCPWEASVAELAPLCIILTETSEASRSLALFLKTSVQHFLLLTSSRFQGWYPGFYEGLEMHTVSAYDLRNDKLTAERLQQKTILIATVGAFSSVSTTIRHVGLPQILLVDEASLLSSPVLVSTLQQMPGLTKMAVFGDPKQLPPYMQGEMPDIHSVLDTLIDCHEHTDRGAKHIRLVSLDRSRRLPLMLTNFLSINRYDSKLLHADGSTPTRTRKGDHAGYLQIIELDSRHDKRASSTFNCREAEVVGDLVGMCLAKGLSVSVITYYSAQRAEIERVCRRRFGQTHTEMLDKVCTVDASQGKEDDIIILSTAATYFSTKPSREHFLRDQNRQTVALSRCRKKMIIVTNKNFMFDLQKHCPEVLLHLLYDECYPLAWPGGHERISWWLDGSQTPREGPESFRQRSR